MCTVTLINLSFIEVVFLHISPCNSGHAWPAVSVWAVPVLVVHRLSTEPSIVLLQKLRESATLLAGHCLTLITFCRAVKEPDHFEVRKS